LEPKISGNYEEKMKNVNTVNL